MTLLDFLPPIAGTLAMAYMFWMIHKDANDPEMIRLRQKADYERAHAYKPEEPHGN